MERGGLPYITSADIFIRSRPTHTHTKKKAYVCAALYAHLLCNLDQYKNDHAGRSAVCTCPIVVSLSTRSSVG